MNINSGGGMALKRIHVNQHKIRRKESDPISVKVSGKTIPCSEVEIRGESKLVYRPDKPLSCGAKLWVETRSPLEIGDITIQ